MLAAALLGQGRRVFVLANGLPDPVVEGIARAGRARRIPVAAPMQVLEVAAR